VIGATADRPTASVGVDGMTVVRISAVIEGTAEATDRTIATTNAAALITARITAAREGIGALTGKIMPPVQTARADSITNGTKNLSPAGNTETVEEGVTETNNITV